MGLGNRYGQCFNATLQRVGWVGVRSNIQETHAYSALWLQELAEWNNRGDRKYCVATSDKQEKSWETFAVTWPGKQREKKMLKMTLVILATLLSMFWAFVSNKVKMKIEGICFLQFLFRRALLLLILNDGVMAAEPCNEMLCCTETEIQTPFRIKYLLRWPPITYSFSSIKKGQRSFKRECLTWEQHSCSTPFFF